MYRSLKEVEARDRATEAAEAKAQAAWKREIVAMKEVQTELKCVNGTRQGKRIRKLLDQIDFIIDHESNYCMDKTLAQIARYVEFLKNVHQFDKKRHQDMLGRLTHVDEYTKHVEEASS